MQINKIKVGIKYNYFEKMDIGYNFLDKFIVLISKQQVTTILFSMQNFGISYNKIIYIFIRIILGKPSNCNKYCLL